MAGLTDFLQGGANFLADLGGNGLVGQVAQAFGGRTRPQRQIDVFTNEQLPGFAEQISRAGSEEELAKIGNAVVTAGAQAGIPGQGIEKIMGMLVAPAIQNLRKGEAEKIIARNAAQPGQPRPEGTEGPLDQAGNFVPAQPAKPFSEADMIQLNRATGGDAKTLDTLFRAPAQNALNQEQAKGLAGRQQRLNQLPDSPIGDTDVSLRTLAEFPSTVGAIPMREQSDSKQEQDKRMYDLKLQGLQNQLDIADRKAREANEKNDQNVSRTNFTQARQLRSEFNKESENFRAVRDSYNRIQTSSNNPSPAGDMSMLFGYMKMIDPGSRAVTDADFRNAQTARPLLERLGLSWDAVGSVWAGRAMTPGMREDFRKRAQEYYSTENQQHQQRIGEYTRLADRYKIPADEIITNMEAAQQPSAPSAPQPQQSGAPSGAPPVGTVSKGYRFKGGNPADKNSWEKVQ